MAPDDLVIRSPARPWVLRARPRTLRVAPSGLARFATANVTQGKTSTPCLRAEIAKNHPPVRLSSASKGLALPEDP